MTISPTHIGATILLNKLRLIGLFDLLLLLKSFVFDSIHEDLEMGPYITIILQLSCVCVCVCVWYGLRRRKRERVVGNEV